MSISYVDPSPPLPPREGHTLHQDLAWGDDWPAPFHAEVISKPKPSHVTSLHSTLQYFPVDLRNSIPMDHRPFLPPPWACWALHSGRSAPCPELGHSDLPLSCSFFLGHNLPTRTPAVWQTPHSSGFGSESTSLGPPESGFQVAILSAPFSGLLGAEQSHCAVTAAAQQPRSHPAASPSPPRALSSVRTGSGSVFSTCKTVRPAPRTREAGCVFGEFIHERVNLFTRTNGSYHQ